MNKVCPNCGAELNENAKFCNNCGSSVAEKQSILICKGCGNELTPGAKFCRNCGASVEMELPAVEQQKCSNCGAEIDPTAKYCRSCGAPVAAVIIEENNEAVSLEEPIEKEDKETEAVKPKAVKSKNKTALWIALCFAFVAIIAACVIFLPKNKANNTASANTDSSEHSDSETDKENQVQTAETEQVSMIDLSKEMNNITTLHQVLHGLEVGDQGTYEHWYQSLDSTYGYGNYKDSEQVDTFWSTEKDHSLFGVSVGTDLSEAKSTLSSSGWVEEYESDNISQFKKDDMIFTLVSNSNHSVDRIGFDRERPAEFVQNTVPEPESVSSDYFFPDSLDVLLSESQLSGMTARELTLARNEIYARYGYTFQREDLQEYFNTKSWYTADPAVNKDTIGSYVSSIGMQNMVMIREYQKAHGLMY